MYYTVYKITNKIDGKIYIGKHQTKKLDDGYMGLGKHLKRAIEKYGIENFSKEILFTFDNESDMNLKEAELVTEEFCDRKDTYNICIGGQGGFGYINSNLPNGMLGKCQTENQKNIAKKSIKFLHNNSLHKIGGKNSYKKTLDGFWLGRHHTEETKEKLRISKNVGKINSQFGSMWITNGEKNKKIKALDTIPDGWYKGRIF